MALMLINGSNSTNARRTVDWPGPNFTTIMTSLLKATNTLLLLGMILKFYIIKMNHRSHSNSILQDYVKRF